MRGTYLLAVLFRPAALAPSACRRDQTPALARGADTESSPCHPTRPPLSPAFGHRGERALSPCSVPPGWKTLPPVVRGSQLTPQPKFAGPFKSSGAPIANTNPATTEPWGLGEK